MITTTHPHYRQHEISNLLKGLNEAENSRAHRTIRQATYDMKHIASKTAYAIFSKTNLRLIP